MILRLDTCLFCVFSLYLGVDAFELGLQALELAQHCGTHHRLASLTTHRRTHDMGGKHTVNVSEGSLWVVGCSLRTRRLPPPHHHPDTLHSPKYTTIFQIDPTPFPSEHDHDICIMFLHVSLGPSAAAERRRRVRRPPAPRPWSAPWPRTSATTGGPTPPSAFHIIT